MGIKRQIVAYHQIVGPMAEPTVVARKRITRAEGYLVPQSHIMGITVRVNEQEATGYGEAQTIEYASAKAESEAIERCLLKLARRFGLRPRSSNGWACHIDAEHATKAAVSELVEREVACATWESGEPYLEIPKDLWPLPVLQWDASKAFEYSDLKILLNTSKHGCCVSALLFNGDMNFVSGHATSDQLKDAILSAVQECFRAAHMALRFEYFAETERLHKVDQSDLTPFEPGVHALAYAYTKIPPHVRTALSDIATVHTHWNRHKSYLKNHIANAEVQIFKIGSRFVANAQVPSFREMRWGPSLNSSLLKNSSPHIVG